MKLFQFCTNDSVKKRETWSNHMDGRKENFFAPIQFFLCNVSASFLCQLYRKTEEKFNKKWSRKAPSLFNGRGCRGLTAKSGEEKRIISILSPWNMNEGDWVGSRTIAAWAVEYSSTEFHHDLIIIYQFILHNTMITAEATFSQECR